MSRPAFDPDAIRALAAILVETGLTEIEVAEKDSRVRLVREPAAVAPSAPAPPAQSAVLAARPAPETAAADDEATHPGAVLSPMVGIVYLSPEPGAAPFVSVGQTVTAGQTLLLIEAMKTFNQIKAPKAGTVTRIHVSSGMPVEYGEVLAIVE
ncbi:MAG: acetyl-CoA carboxylase biotin carboxyl carrier protein [Acetobacteraceae bacterium]|nr:acetyl-CoA carboxylase biotin carboxyl carrier protein [Acetobacteraceae bacterium]